MEGESLTVAVETEAQAAVLIRLLENAPRGNAEIRVKVTHREDKATVSLHPTYSLTPELRDKLESIHTIH